MDGGHQLRRGRGGVGARLEGRQRHQDATVLGRAVAALQLGVDLGFNASQGATFHARAQHRQQAHALVQVLAIAGDRGAGLAALQVVHELLALLGSLQRGDFGLEAIEDLGLLGGELVVLALGAGQQGAGDLEVRCSRRAERVIVVSPGVMIGIPGTLLIPSHH